MILSFKVSNFRCLEDAELAFSPDFNLVYGSNASGKTSLLEALAYLGRGKSFRGASTSDLVQHGKDEFVLFGRVEKDGIQHKVGVRNSREGLEVRVDRPGAVLTDRVADLDPPAEPGQRGLVLVTKTHLHLAEIADEELLAQLLAGAVVAQDEP